MRGLQDPGRDPRTSAARLIPADYTGRFAPSVTGPLHFGSLIAAVASYLDARANQGRWLLRLDDLDVPRLIPGADDEILAALNAHALRWDGRVVRQSERTDAYRSAFTELSKRAELFLCTCSRRKLKGISPYPGTCRAHVLSSAAHIDLPGSGAAGDAAVRIRARGRIDFDDRVFGAQTEQLEQATGDFIVRRRDGLYAYQLAVVVDDDDAGVTHIVRGADLLDNTPRQLFLTATLGLAEPSYAHIPVIADRRGAKLSKQTFAGAITAHNAAGNLHAALTLLGQEPPASLARATPEEVLEWGAEQWEIGKVVPEPAFSGFVSI